jgi:hypothetical protein
MSWLLAQEQSVEIWPIFFKKKLAIFLNREYSTNYFLKNVT